MNVSNTGTVAAWLAPLLVVWVGGCAFEDPLPRIVLDPPSGTYDHGLMVAFSREDGAELGSNPEMKVDGGAYEELFTTRCDAADISETNFCYSVNESVSFSVREYDLNRDAPETFGEYVIESPTLDVSLNGDTFDELRTNCSIHRPEGGPDARLYVTIQLENTAVLEPDWLAWVVLEVPYSGDAPPVDEVLVLDSPETARVETGPSAPGSYHEHYFAQVDSPCAVTLTDFTRGAKVAGTIECTDLVPSATNLEELLGPGVDVARADWVCDSW